MRNFVHRQFVGFDSILEWGHISGEGRSNHGHTNNNVYPILNKSDLNIHTNTVYHNTSNIHTHTHTTLQTNKKRTERTCLYCTQVCTVVNKNATQHKICNYYHINILLLPPPSATVPRALAPARGCHTQQQHGKKKTLLLSPHPTDTAPCTRVATKHVIHLQHQALQGVRSSLGHLWISATGQSPQRLQGRHPHPLGLVSV